MVAGGGNAVTVQSRVLVYDRIGANKRETWFLMSLFVVLGVGLVSAFLFAWGAPSPRSPLAPGWRWRA